MERKHIKTMNYIDVLEQTMNYIDVLGQQVSSVGWELVMLGGERRPTTLLTCRSHTALRVSQSRCPLHSRG